MMVPNRVQRVRGRAVLAYVAGTMAVSLCMAGLDGTLTAQQPAGSIGFRAATSAVNEAARESLTIQTPNVAAPDDVLLATVFVRGVVGDARKTATVAAPAGWTLVRRDDCTKDNVPGGVSSLVSYVRVATASEPASYTWTFDARRLAMGSIAAFTGVNTSTPIDAHKGNAALPDAYTKIIPAPAITTTLAGTLVVGIFGLHEGGHSIAPPEGMTGRFERTSPEPLAGPRPVAASLTLRIADELRSSAGATEERRAAATTADTWVAQLIALRPASSRKPSR